MHYMCDTTVHLLCIAHQQVFLSGLLHLKIESLKIQVGTTQYVFLHRQDG